MASTTTLVTDSLPDITNPKQEPEEKTFKKMTIAEKLTFTRKLITVEPLLASYIFASVLCGPALNNLEIEKACRVNGGYNDTICDAILEGNVDNYTTENNNIQGLIVDMHSWQTPLQSIMPLILVLFLGAYSDRHNLRKPFLLLPIFGEFFAVAACVLCVIFMRTWPLEALGVSQTVIPSFFGGQTMLVMAVFSYIADVSTLEERTLRIGIVQITINVFLLAAQPLSGFLFSEIGYIGVLCTACVIFLLGLFYGIFRIEEKRKPMDVFENGVKGCILDVFNPKHAIDTIAIVFKDKKGNNRLFILFVMVILFITSGVLVAEFSIFFLFTQTSYGWTAVEFSYYLTLQTALYLFGAAAALPLFTKVFKFNDYTIMLISFCDKIVATVIAAYAYTPVWMIVATIVGIIQREATIGIRSVITKIVSEDDMGKAQSLFGICEAAAPAIMAPIFNQLYSHTLTSFKGSGFLLGAALYLVVVAITLQMWKMNRTNLKAEKENDKIDGDSDKTVPISDLQTTHI